MRDQQSNEYLLVFQMKHFIAHFKRNVCKPSEKAEQRVAVLQFLCLTNENLLVKHTVVIVEGQQTADFVTNVAQGLHCFNWNEMNQF